MPAIRGSPAAQAALNVVMSMNPIGLVILAVVAFAAALVLAYHHSETFRNVVSGAFNAVKAVVSGAVSAMTGAINGFKAVLSHGFDGFSSAGRAAFNAVARAWNNTVGKLSFRVPSWVPGLGGKGWDVPDIPLMAKGGIVTRPTLAMIGEAGPEAVVPLGRGGLGVTINIYGGTFVDADEFIDRVRTGLLRKGMRNASLGLA